MRIATIALAVLIALPCADGAFAKNRTGKINGSIEVGNAEQAGDLSTVNGSIRIAATGSADEVSTVNGGVRLGAKARAKSVETVNGGIDLDEGARVAGDVSTVNGGLAFGKGADVGGRVRSVNGRIVLDAAHVGGGIETVVASIDVGADSRVEGGILVKKPRGSSNDSRVPRVVIGPRAVVQGDLVFEREVELFVSDSATVGAISGASAKKFSGERP